MNISTDQSPYWDRSTSSKSFAHPLDLDRFVQRVPRDAAVLDYGCGHGRLCHALSQRGYHRVLGVDSSSAMIQVARANHPGLDFSVVQSGELPFPDASFGAVLLFAVLTCIPSSADQARLMADVHRVLRPGGCLVISDYPLQTTASNATRSP
ncbi:MAG TPA: class I SAM-dependent methyltransferase [Burkholderiaceae bacterium]|jgi:SAM-dependent methyltransferase|nr:class I SAM-dependent methyltransferase [Burkholderiaceae bacterium]